MYKIQQQKHNAKIDSVVGSDVSENERETIAEIKERYACIVLRKVSIAFFVRRTFGTESGI